MSAFFFLLNRDKSDVDQQQAELMMEQLDIFGPHSKQLHVENNFAVGYQSLWTVPEEQGERQPIHDSELDLWLVFYGRIDNREDLFQSLGKVETKSISDAQLFLLLYKSQGESAFETIIGPFVFVLFSQSNQSIIAARDSMGGRYLVYRITTEHILISTFEMAIVAHPSVDYQFNHTKVAKMLAFMADDVPASMIEGIEPLQSGQLLKVIGQGEAQLSTYYLPDPKKRIRLSSNQAYAVEFKRLLTQAVERRLRSNSLIGTMLSGGLDSVPISILAAQILNSKGQKVNAFSWVFDEHPIADERKYSKVVCEDFSIKANWINCDHVWPQFDEDTCCNPVLPFHSPYSEFNQRLFDHAQQQGVSVMLSGVGGDMLYTGTEGILFELLKTGQFNKLMSEVKCLISDSGSKWLFAKKYLLTPLIRGFLERRRINKSVSFAFLSDSIQSSLNNQKSNLDSIMWKSLRPKQYVNVIGSYEGEDAGYGKHMDAKYQIERRFPFRDRDLVEFMLAIPSDQLSFALEQRPIVKRAFEEEFSEELITRNSKTNFTSVILAGINTDNEYLKWFNSGNVAWQRYVKECYFVEELEDGISQSIIKWYCGYHEYWKAVCYTPLKAKLGFGYEK